MCVYHLCERETKTAHTQVAEQAPENASVHAEVMKATPNWKNALSNSQLIYRVLQHYFLEGQFFIAKEKVVPVIKHYIATWAACDIVSVMLIILLQLN